MILPRDRKKPVLTVDGRRLVHVEWLRGTVCERCGNTAPAGYAGPATGQIFRSTGDSHYLCESCARARLGLEPGELTGHTCGSKCTDDVHTELRLEEASFLDLTPQERLRTLQAELGPRGWTVRSVEEVKGPPVPGGPPWRLVLVSTRLDAGAGAPAGAGPDTAAE